MAWSAKKIINGAVNIFGYKISKACDSRIDRVIDADETFLTIYKKCAAYAMAPRERLYALYQAVKYIINAQIRGDFVECGVWRGGNVMLIAYTLLQHNETMRKIWLYDTFAGMSEPTENDYWVTNKKIIRADDKWKKMQSENYNEWCYASLLEVEKNLNLTAYPRNNLHFIRGRVEETIPKFIPTTISLLRLDTDWYESTKHELTHLFPRLSTNGVLLIDDYGSWVGSKRATDEYFSRDCQILLTRIDEDSRIGIKIK
mgnify:CR=1 FL=1